MNRAQNSLLSQPSEDAVYGFLDKTTNTFFAFDTEE